MKLLLAAVIFIGFTTVAHAGSPKAPSVYGSSPTSPMNADINFGASTVSGSLGIANGGTCGTGAVREATTSTTLVITDCGNIVKLTSSSAIVATVPLNSTAPFAIGSQINLLQYDAGSASVAAASGVTIRKLSTLTFVGQWSRVVLTKIGTDEWLADGALQ